MKIKPYTYYKECYITDNIKRYYLYITDTKYVYQIAYKYKYKDKDNPLIKYDEKLKCGTIREWQEDTNTHSYNVKEISKGDVFLEML